MVKKPEKRLLWADLVRTIAIYFVLATHLLSLPPKFSHEFIGSYISAAIAATCIPLFVMLSGALLLGKKENYKTFFSKRFTRLILPWITWTIIFTLITIYNSPDREITKIIQTMRSTLISFWFLPMIAGLYLVTPATRIFLQSARNQDIIFVITLWFLIVSFLPHFRNTQAFPLFVDNSILRQVVTYYGYFLLGYFLISIKPKKNLISIFMALFTLGITWTLLSISKGFNLGYISPGIIIVSISLFGLVYLLTYKVDKNLSHYFRYIAKVISQAALGIYFIHSLLTQVYRSFSGKMYLFNIYAPLDNYLNALVLFFISFLIIYSLQQIAFVKKIIS